jgi:hypothetical protein
MQKMMKSDDIVKLNKKIRTDVLVVDIETQKK